MALTRRAVIAGLALSGCVAGRVRADVLSFPAEDGVAVTGQAYGGGRSGVVLVPGGHGVGETWEVQAERLAGAGLRVLAMDYRGRGRAARAAPDDNKAHLDVLGAVRWLRLQGAERVAVVGASWGGWAAATAAVSAPELIDRLVLLAHSPFDHPERLGGRKLFVVAEGDRDGTGRPRLVTIREQHDRAPPPKELVVLDGAAHAQFLFLTRQSERLYAEMLRFLIAP